MEELKEAVQCREDNKYPFFFALTSQKAAVDSMERKFYVTIVY